MKIFLKFSFMILSDIYRGFVYIKEVLQSNTNHSFDVAYITNFNNSVEQGFMGISSLWCDKAFVPALKLQLGDVRGRYIAINNVAKDMNRNPVTGEITDGMKVARKQARQAIKYSVRKGVRVVLFGASTKRLFSKQELAEFTTCHPGVIFTIGDNGTVIALWQDVRSALDKNDISKDDGIVVIGPNGFLGSVIRKKLLENGYTNIIPISQRGHNPFAEARDVKLVVACSHHHRVRLSQSIIKDIMYHGGVHVIDVCKPFNFSRAEYENCKREGILVTRQDAGNMMNVNLAYSGSVIASVALKQLNLSQERLFGCFSEATALAYSNSSSQGNMFLTVNDPAINIVGDAFKQSQFVTAPQCNFGNVL
ncbi:MAG: hypothetical protein ACKUBY_04390 [Candidatus Moraniibacteriota bacterium]|jgi:hypothetical protein